MILFNGEYEATVDAKGRFLLPGGLRKQMPEGDNRFMINRGFEGCLNMYPVKNWDLVVGEILGKNDYDAKVRDFKRKFLAGATIVEIDSAGRILIPQGLKQYAGLGKDITLASIGNRVELWDTGKYKQFFEDFSAEDFSNLAREVMAGGDSPAAG
ncbi:MAG TPA: division/cell wall cluster transcriptional repressor MraZ [Chitinophagaceae bacterium]